MSENKSQDTTQNNEFKVRVRDYPKTVYLWPSMVVGFIFWVFSILINYFNLYSGQSSSINALFATIWLVIFTFNLFVISFDFSAGRTFTILISLFTIVLLYIIIRDYFNFSVTQVFPSFKTFLQDTGLNVSTVFYLYISLILAFIYLILFLKGFIIYWEFEPNRILHRRGLFDEEESFPAQASRVITQTPDIFERLLFRAGTIYIVVGDNKIHKLENVYNAASKDDKIQKILSVINVESDKDVG